MQKFIHVVFYSKVQLTFKKLPPVNLGLAPKRNIYGNVKKVWKYSFFPELYNCIKCDFLRKPKQKQ